MQIPICRDSNMDFNNLVFVSRPINFLNALEICLSYPERNFIILIYPNTDQLETNAIEFLKADFGEKLPNVKFERYKTLISQDFLNLLLFKWYLKFRFLKKEFNLISFSGGVKGRLLYKNIRFKNLIITDEGTTSLKRFPEMIEEKRLFPKPKGPRYKFMYGILGIEDIKDRRDFCIFTIYEKLNQISEKIYANHFEQLRKYIHSKGNFDMQEKTIIILGSNPFPSGVSEDHYKSIIIKVYQKYSDYDIFLKTHKTYSKTFGLPVLETNLPIEYYFLKQKTIPGMVMSFGSTANQLLALLFPEIKVVNLV